MKKETKRLPKFYSNKILSSLRDNAKKLLNHPIYSKIDVILTQIKELRQHHHRFLFAALSEVYGDKKARIFMQNEIVKEKIESFIDVDSRCLKSIETAKKDSNKIKNLLSLLKQSFYFKRKDPLKIKSDLLHELGNKFPDLIKLPKNV